MRLTVEGQESNERIMTFSLHLSGADVDVYANQEMIGWFELYQGRIRYVSSTPAQSDRDLFHLDENGFIKTGT